MIPYSLLKGQIEQKDQKLTRLWCQKNHTDIGADHHMMYGQIVASVPPYFHLSICKPIGKHMILYQVNGHLEISGIHTQEYIRFKLQL